MAVNSAFRGYSVFDTVMRKQRTERLSRGISANQTDIQVNTLAEKAPTSSETASKAFAGPATIAEGFDSPFMDTQYVSVDKTGQVRTPRPGDQYNISGPTTYLTAGEAAVSPDLRTGYYGPFDPHSGMGKFAYGLAQAIVPLPFVADLIGGNKTVDPYGKEVTIPLGTLGKLARMNIEKQYEVAKKIEAGTPGYHQFYSGGQLLSIVPQKNPLTGNFMGNYTVLGTFSGSPQDVINQFAAMHGYNPPSIDLDKKPGEKGFGEELEAFVPGSGGFTKDKRFVSPTGEVTSVPSDLPAHLGLVNTMYGQEVAMNTLNGLNLSEDTASKLSAAIANNTLRAEAVRYSDGSIAGYNTGSGSIVTTKDGTAVRGGGGAVTSGTGALSADQKDELSYQIGTAQRYDTRPGSQQTRMLAEQDRDFYDPQRDYDPGFDEGDTGDSGGQGGYGGRGGAENETGYGTPFAQGGFVERTPMQEGGQAPVVNKPGFIGKEPEGLPEGMTVADDIEIDVPEGTFVLSAAAVEFMGSADVKAMILEAITEAEKQGIDITQDTSKISREDLVSLVVSKGEVVIPPELAQIIGYDRLNKINNRGKQEVQKRIDENGQAEQPQEGPPVTQAAEGVDTRGVIDLDEVDHYRKFKNPNASLGNYFEQVGATLTRNTDAMEKAFSYSTQYRKKHNTSDKIEDTFRHGLVGGLYGPLGRLYADFKEKEHIYATQSTIDAFNEDNPLRGSFLNPVTEKVDTTKLQKINKESKIDLENNTYGGILRQQIPDEREFVRAFEKIMDIVRTEGIDKVPSLYDENGKEVRLQLSTVPQRKGK